MALPEPVLDDLQFQKDLVDEARRRIIHYCPEWTDYNLSDPGITLIELFAWMTELIVYRLNRVPDKIYIKLLELLGIKLRPAHSAQTELTFWLSTPFPINPGDDTTAVVSPGTEVATRRTEEEDEVIFTTDDKLVIRPPKLAYLKRDGEIEKDYLSRLNKETFYPFQDLPQVGDTFYLGFAEEQDISGHILQLTFECEKTQAVGIQRSDPPLVWACSMGDDQWQEIALSQRPGEEDTTGGLNNEYGKLALYLPIAMRPDEVFGRSAYWVRCRLQPRPGQDTYSESPQIRNISAHALGAAVRATQAVVVEDEILGRSSGDPGQVFQLEHRPILALDAGETVEVEEKMGDVLEFVPWRAVEDFSNSDRYDSHFSLDAAGGEVNFGPTVRHRDGRVHQYGRVPPANRLIRFSRYRYGGGVIGNAPAERLQVLKSSIPYIDRVTNLTRASGGRDPESLAEAKIRARHELRAQHRAVTAEDYEDMSRSATRSIARVKCNAPQQSNGHLAPGMVEILIVPAVADALKRGDLSKLRLSETLAEEVRAYLDGYRLLTTTLQIREPAYIGVQVAAEIVRVESSRPEVVRARVVERLNNFVNCLVLNQNHSGWDELMDPDWEGWPFGRNLYVAEIMSLIQRVPGVKHVLDVQLSTRPIVPGDENPDGEETEENEALSTPVTGKVLRVPADALLCSLKHKIMMVELDDNV